MQNEKRPKAADVKPLEDYRLLIFFDNGEQKVFDCRPLIKGDFYGRLQDPDLFKTVHIDGLSIAWDEGQDVCPDELYNESIPMEDFLNRLLRLVDLIAAPHQMEITQDPYEGGYAVTFPELPGCYALGDTIEQAVAKSFDAKRIWMEDALAQDLPIPRPTGKNNEDGSTTEAVFIPKPGYYGYYANLQDAKEESRREIYERAFPEFIEAAFERGDDKEAMISDIVDVFGYVKEKVTEDVDYYIKKKDER